jgi:orotidine-5'-phosphate decarboxylase
VARRTEQAMQAGVEGIVTSPREAAMVRGIVGPDAVIVTPGVRSAGREASDQKRVATPADAIRAGANYLVMGRQITRASDPAAEFARVVEEIL